MTSITKLKGVGEATAKKLSKGGIDEIEQLMIYPPPKVAEMLGVDNETTRLLYQKARVALDDTEIFISGIEAKKLDDNKERISTGTKALDRLFQGGIECESTTEIYGEFGCGKTQFCHSQAVRTQLPKEEGGLDGKVIYVDSEGTFKPSRITSIAESLGLDPDKTLENILVAKCKNSMDQYMVMGEVGKLLTKDKSIKLVIVDSAIGLFRGDYSGRGMLSERQKYLSEFLVLSENIAGFYKVAVIWTNQIMISPTAYGDPVTAIGGAVLAHKSTYRVYFKKSGVYRIAKMVDSPKDAQTEVTFGLSIAGVVDKEVVEQLEKERLKAKAAEKKATKAKDEA